MLTSINNARGERRWVVVWAVVIVAIGCLPYLIAWQTTPEGYEFGGFLVNPLDGNSYLAKMRQGWMGHWQFHLTYTPDTHDGAYVYLLYLGLGHLARLIRLPLVVVYHLARVLAGLVMLVSIYAFVERLTTDRRERWLFLWLAGTSAGLGWLTVALGAFPIDLWIPEGFAFFSLLTNPHFPLALAMMVLIVRGMVWPATGTRRWLVPGLAAFTLSLVQPLALPVVYATLGLYLVLKWLNDRHLQHDVPCRPKAEMVVVASVVLFSIPLLAYDLWVFSANPAMAAWSAQNVTPTPPIYDLILGYGLVALLAIPGGLVSVRRRDLAGVALLLWSIGTLILVYLPLALQRRLITGLGIPLAILAGIGVSHWLSPRLPGGWKRLTGGLVVTFCFIGSLFLLIVLVAGALGQQKQPEQPVPLYLSSDEADGMAWLLDHARDEVVLSAPTTGMFLPGRAGVRVLYGHPYETINAEARQNQALAFFRGELTDNQWQKIKKEYHVSYIFLGPGERCLGTHHAFDTSQPVFRQGEVAIYHLP